MRPVPVMKQRNVLLTEKFSHPKSSFLEALRSPGVITLILGIFLLLNPEGQLVLIGRK